MSSFNCNLTINNQVNDNIYDKLLPENNQKEKFKQNSVKVKNAASFSFSQKIKGIFAHINLNVAHKDGTKKNTKFSVKDLSDLTHLKTTTLFLKKITGKLDLDYVLYRMAKKESIENIIAHSSDRARKTNRNVEAHTKQVKKMIATTMKCKNLSELEKLSRGVLYKVDKNLHYLIQKDNKYSRLKFLEISSKTNLGAGSLSVVFEAQDLATKTAESKAIKFAFTSEIVPEAEDALQNEFISLTEIHKDGHVIGIQDAPDCVINLEDLNRDIDDMFFNPSKGVGYITNKYDFTLGNTAAFNKVMPSLKEKVVASYSLFNGLLFLHNKDIVHKDIKPDNMCAKNGELQLADFGGAVKASNISLEFPLSGITKEFTSVSDWKELEQIIEKSKLDDIDKNQLTKELVELYMCRDVYCLGISLLSIFSGNEKLNGWENKDLEQALADLALHPELTSVQPKLNNLIKKMISDNRQERLTIQEAMAQYKEIMLAFDSKPEMNKSLPKTLDLNEIHRKSRLSKIFV